MTGDAWQVIMAAVKCQDCDVGLVLWRTSNELSGKYTNVGVSTISLPVCC